MQTLLVLLCACAASGSQILDRFKLKEGPNAHALKSDPIELVNTKTIRIPNLHYDGKGPDAFWIVGRDGAPVPGERPAQAPGSKIPDQDGKCDLLRAYNGETIQLVLPVNLTVNDIDWLAMYCFKYKHTFGWVDFATVRNGFPGKRFESVPEADPDLVGPKPCGESAVGASGSLIGGLLAVLLNIVGFQHV